MLCLIRFLLPTRRSLPLFVLHVFRWRSSKMITRAWRHIVACIDHHSSWSTFLWSVCPTLTIHKETRSLSWMSINAKTMKTINSTLASLAVRMVTKILHRELLCFVSFALYSRYSFFFRMKIVKNCSG